MTNTPVPHLTTALTGPLQELEKHFLQNQNKIECWFRSQWQKTLPPIYGSVDLRNAGFKLAPVDMNLFPAGFNNLNPAFTPLCIQAMEETVEKCRPGAMRILIIPENHTRNQFYLENLFVLQDIMLKAGFEARIGSLISDLKHPEIITLDSGKTLHLEPIQRADDKVFLDGFEPCLIWLNNDLSAGIPEILKDIRQTVRPPLRLGWNNRLKSFHFKVYQSVVQEFSEKFSLDPWLINPYFKNCHQVDFLARDGMECLANKARELMDKIQKKYDEYQINEKPFVIIKADAGTYGMSVMTLTDPDELLNLNRKQRTHMSSVKSGNKVNRVLLQEGVYTFETIGEEKSVAEPVIYMIGKHVVGGFYRVHKHRGKTENLNAPGAHFEPLAFTNACNNPDKTLNPDACPNRFYAYGVIARLSMLAAAREKKALEEN